jgi:hypothetical protein
MDPLSNGPQTFYWYTDIFDFTEPIGYGFFNPFSLALYPESGGFLEGITYQPPFGDFNNTGEQGYEQENNGAANGPGAGQTGAGKLMPGSPSVRGSVQLPQQHPLVPKQLEPTNKLAIPRGRASSGAGAELCTIFPSQEPLGTEAADSGIYTCTYPTCVRRFDTVKAMRKHKVDEHKRMKTHGQAESHACTRINLSGNRCNTTFSRPYDLTRHEDTCHNVGRQKPRCELCGKEFAREDAKSRHMLQMH